MLDIKIFGSGCPNCIKLENLVKEVLSEANIPAQIEKISDKEKYLEYGVMMTPALLVNGKIVVMGKIPTKPTLENYFKTLQ